MSKPPKWRVIAKNAAKEYPALVKARDELHQQSVSPSLSGMPRAGGEHRGTEEVAMRELPYHKQRKLDAVEQAVRVSSQLTSGLCRVKLIELVYFKQKYTIEGAAMQIPCSVQTAYTWSNDFLLLVWSRLKDS